MLVFILLILGPLWVSGHGDTCPCLHRDVCPRVYGDSELDLKEFGTLDPCEMSDEVRCCGVTVSVVQEEESQDEEEKFPFLSEIQGFLAEDEDDGDETGDLYRWTDFSVDDDMDSMEAAESVQASVSLPMESRSFEESRRKFPFRRRGYRRRRPSAAEEDASTPNPYEVEDSTTPNPLTTTYEHTSTNKPGLMPFKPKIRPFISRRYKNSKPSYSSSNQESLRPETQSSFLPTHVTLDEHQQEERSESSLETTTLANNAAAKPAPFRRPYTSLSKLFKSRTSSSSVENKEEKSTAYTSEGADEMPKVTMTNPEQKLSPSTPQPATPPPKIQPLEESAQINSRRRYFLKRPLQHRLPTGETPNSISGKSSIINAPIAPVFEETAEQVLSSSETPAINESAGNNGAEIISSQETTSSSVEKTSKYENEGERQSQLSSEEPVWKKSHVLSSMRKNLLRRPAGLSTGSNLQNIQAENETVSGPSTPQRSTPFRRMPLLYRRRGSSTESVAAASTTSEPTTTTTSTTTTTTEATTTAVVVEVEEDLIKEVAQEKAPSVTMNSTSDDDDGNEELFSVQEVITRRPGRRILRKRVRAPPAKPEVMSVQAQRVQGRRQPIISSTYSNVRTNDQNSEKSTTSGGRFAVPSSFSFNFVSNKQNSDDISENNKHAEGVTSSLDKDNYDIILNSKDRKSDSVTGPSDQTVYEPQRNTPTTSDRLSKPNIRRYNHFNRLTTTSIPLTPSPFTTPSPAEKTPEPSTERSFDQEFPSYHGEYQETGDDETIGMPEDDDDMYMKGPANIAYELSQQSGNSAQSTYNWEDGQFNWNPYMDNQSKPSWHTNQYGTSAGDPYDNPSLSSFVDWDEYERNQGYSYSSQWKPISSNHYEQESRTQNQRVRFRSTTTTTTRPVAQSHLSSFTFPPFRKSVREHVETTPSPPVPTAFTPEPAVRQIVAPTAITPPKTSPFPPVNMASGGEKSSMTRFQVPSSFNLTLGRKETKPGMGRVKFPEENIRPPSEPISLFQLTNHLPQEEKAVHKVRPQQSNFHLPRQPVSMPTLSQTISTQNQGHQAAQFPPAGQQVSMAAHGQNPSLENDHSMNLRQRLTAQSNRTHSPMTVSHPPPSHLPHQHNQFSLAVHKNQLQQVSGHLLSQPPVQSQRGVPKPSLLTGGANAFSAQEESVRNVPARDPLTSATDSTRHPEHKDLSKFNSNQGFIQVSNTDLQQHKQGTLPATMKHLPVKLHFIQPSGNVKFQSDVLKDAHNMQHSPMEMEQSHGKAEEHPNDVHHSQQHPSNFFQVSHESKPMKENSLTNFTPGQLGASNALPFGSGHQVIATNVPNHHYVKGSSRLKEQSENQSGSNSPVTKPFALGTSNSQGNLFKAHVSNESMPLATSNVSNRPIADIQFFSPTQIPLVKSVSSNKQAGRHVLPQQKQQHRFPASFTAPREILPEAPKQPPRLQSTFTGHRVEINKKQSQQKQNNLHKPFPGNQKISQNNQQLIRPQSTFTDHKIEFSKENHSPQHPLQSSSAQKANSHESHQQQLNDLTFLAPNRKPQHGHQHSQLPQSHFPSNQKKLPGQHLHHAQNELQTKKPQPIPRPLTVPSQTVIENGKTVHMSTDHGIPQDLRQSQPAAQQPTHTQSKPSATSTAHHPFHSIPPRQPNSHPENNWQLVEPNMSPQRQPEISQHSATFQAPAKQPTDLGSLHRKHQAQLSSSSVNGHNDKQHQRLQQQQQQIRLPHGGFNMSALREPSSSQNVRSPPTAPRPIDMRNRGVSAGSQPPMMLTTHQGPGNVGLRPMAVTASAAPNFPKQLDHGMLSSCPPTMPHCQQGNRLGNVQLIRQSGSRGSRSFNATSLINSKQEDGGANQPRIPTRVRTARAAFFSEDEIGESSAATGVAADATTALEMSSTSSAEATKGKTEELAEKDAEQPEKVKLSSRGISIKNGKKFDLMERKRTDERQLKKELETAFVGEFKAPRLVERGFHPILPYSEEDPGPVRSPHVPRFRNKVSPVVP